MLIKRIEISKITVIDNEGDDICVVFYLGDDESVGQIRLNCFWKTDVDRDDPKWAAEKEKIIQLARAYINKYPDDAYVELSSRVLYYMNVYW